MKRWEGVKALRSTWIIGATLLLLAACSRPPGSDGSAVAHGRYIGVGVYSAGELWSRMAVAGAPADAKLATLDDDEHVIVVEDSQTGEIRECGDYSGVCVRLDPWTRAIATPQTAPVQLTQHLPELHRQQQTEIQKSQAAQNVPR